jgi:molybdate transport system regulatory protein
MKTSARNQFHGRVTDVERGVIDNVITLEIAGGQKIVAVITRDSTERLGLRPGVEAIALIKSSSVILVTDDEGMRLSARNRLSGTVSRVQPGAVNAEVVLDLGGGGSGSVTAIVTNGSSEALGLQPGVPATAIFKASSVILGVPV